MTEGEDANLVVFDPSERWRASKSTLQSRATNTPYDQRAMLGRPRALVAKGELVLRDGSLT
jgi:dihydroorotase-like cyclic amidohydrolase